MDAKDLFSDPKHLHGALKRVPLVGPMKVKKD